MASGTALKADESAPVSGDGTLSAPRWLLCRAGTRVFALPISDVVETLRPLPIEHLAGAPPLVRGICVIRGEPVAIVDTGALFGDRALNYQRIVTVRIGRRTIGFLAEQVVGVRAIPSDTLAQLPALLSEIETISAIAKLDGELVFFLRTARVISEDCLASIDKRELKT